MPEANNPGSLNPYFTQGTSNEQSMVESLIIESLNIYAVPMLYMPRTLIALDKVLGEDPLSQFNSAFKVPVYMENPTQWDGQNAMLNKFGFSLDQSAKFVVSRKAWKQLVGNSGQSILPQRPTEGDLIYFPLSQGIFEVKYVNIANPFYQLGRLYVYEMTVQLFSYSSEQINTGVDSLDSFNRKSLDELINPTPDQADQSGADNTTIETNESNNAAFDPSNPFNDL